MADISLSFFLNWLVGWLCVVFERIFFYLDVSIGTSTGVVDVDTFHFFHYKLIVTKGSSPEVVHVDISV